MPDASLLKKIEELSARVAALEAENIRVKQENVRLQNENRLLRQKLDQYIRHHFGGQHNEGLDKQQLELLLQGLPNVIVLPTPDNQTPTATRHGAVHPVRRMLAEDRLETHEIVIEPAEVQAQPEGWKKISEERTSQLDWVAPKIIKRVLIRPRYVKDERFAIAPLPPQPIEQGMVGAELAGADSGQQIRISPTALPAGENVPPALRQAIRVWQSQPVLARLHRAMVLIRRKTLPQGLMGQAIDYTLKRWEALTRFVEDGTLEIDNNLIENAIRPSALGKKNWLFVGHPEAGERSAVIYTLLGSCRRHGINPFEYLKDLFTRLPAAKITKIKGFTPAEWVKAKEQAVRLVA